MSVRERQHDAALLWQSGRKEGALLSLLVAVAATSRKRYPRNEEKSDRKAFTQFLKDEMLVLTAGGAEGFRVSVSQADKKRYPDLLVPMQDVFYEFMRCELAHEGRLPGHVRFIEGDGGGWSIEAGREALTLTSSFILFLSNVVVYAPENMCDFPENKEKPDDVVGWELFGKRRESHKEYLAARRKRILELEDHEC